MRILTAFGNTFCFLFSTAPRPNSVAHNAIRLTYSDFCHAFSYDDAQLYDTESTVFRERARVRTVLQYTYGLRVPKRPPSCHATGKMESTPNPPSQITQCDTHLSPQSDLLCWRQDIVGLERDSPCYSAGRFRVSISIVLSRSAVRMRSRMMFFTSIEIHHPCLQIPLERLFRLPRPIVPHRTRPPVFHLHQRFYNLVNLTQDTIASYQPVVDEMTPAPTPSPTFDLSPTAPPPTDPPTPTMPPTTNGGYVALGCWVDSSRDRVLTGSEHKNTPDMTAEVKHDMAKDSGIYVVHLMLLVLIGVFFSGDVVCRV